MLEIWKDIAGYEFYEVSNFGKVRNTKNNKILKGSIRKDGYINFKLSYKGRSFNLLGHRIVAETFLQNPDNKCCINHRDFNKQNNNVNNLEWVTNRENMNHLSGRQYPCIHFDEKYNKFKIIIKINNLSTYFGNYDSIEEAKKVYDETITKLKMGEVVCNLYDKNKYSKFKNVTFDKSRNKWFGYRYENGVRVKKRFKTEEEAYNFTLFII